MSYEDLKALDLLPFEWDDAHQRLKVRLSAKVYPYDVVLSACYTFIDRLYVFVDGDPKGELRVYARPKDPKSAEDIRRLMGDFQNELLAQVLRLRIAKRAGKVRDAIVESALAGAVPRSAALASDPELNQILKDADKMNYHEDPLGIAVPWEEKYGKKKKQETGTEASPRKGEEINSSASGDDPKG